MYYLVESIFFQLYVFHFSQESPKYGWKEYYSCVMTVTSEHLRDLWKQFRRRDMLR